MRHASLATPLAALSPRAAGTPHAPVAPSPSASSSPLAGLPNILDLMAQLERRPLAFHVVLVRIDHGDELAAVNHLAAVLQGAGCIFRVAPQLLVVQLPAAMLHGGRYLVEALTAVPPAGAQLRLVTRTWAGRGEPLATLRAAYEELMEDRFALLEPLNAVNGARRTPPPLPEGAEISVDLML